MSVSRNSFCPCQSGKRYKHCCGSDELCPSGESISDHDLLEALKEADDVGLKAGKEPSARSMLNIGRALERFGYESFILAGRGTPPIVKRAQDLNNRLFLPKELQAGAMHVGAFLFRDMFCSLYAPLAYGTCRIDFLSMLGLSDEQKQWLSHSPEGWATFIDQAADILDFGYGWQEFGHGRAADKRGKNLIWRAHTQLEAAAATAVHAYDFRGTVQSALLGTELVLKAGLATNSVSDTELRSRAIGHDLTAAATKLGQFESGFDTDRVLRVVSAFPNFVASRYDTPTPSRIETGHILMGAQYVASEVTRQFSERNCRNDNSGLPLRCYPQ